MIKVELFSITGGIGSFINEEQLRQLVFLTYGISTRRWFLGFNEVEM